jgi:hypothetical protein
MLAVILRGVLIVILCVVLVGFGVCGAMGTFGGIAGLIDARQSNEVVPVLIGCGLAGLAVAWGAWKALSALWRRGWPGA